MGFKIGDFMENIAEDLGIPGVVAGVGAIVAAPLLIPTIAKVGKPLAKAAIKGSILMYEKSKGMLAEAGEVFEDLIAEAKVELAEEQAQQVSQTTFTDSEVR